MKNMKPIVVSVLHVMQCFIHARYLHTLYSNSTALFKLDTLTIMFKIDFLN